MESLGGLPAPGFTQRRTPRHKHTLTSQLPHFPSSSLTSSHRYFTHTHSLIRRVHTLARTPMSWLPKANGAALMLICCHLPTKTSACCPFIPLYQPLLLPLALATMGVQRRDTHKSTKRVYWASRIHTHTHTVLGV